MEKINSIIPNEHKDGEQNERTEPKSEIIGVTILGSIDPRGLTRQEFQSLPEKVYHGHRKADGLGYEPGYDYEGDSFVLKDSQSGASLGQGLYTTDDLIQAQKYSVMRITNSSEENNEIPAIIDTLVPYQARMLDLRLKDKKEENGSFPKQIAESWIKYYQSFMEYMEDELTKPVGGDPSKIPDAWKVFHRMGTLDQYRRLLDEVISSDNLDLRDLLGTGAKDAFSNSLNQVDHPPWMPLFTEFMKKSGFDGVIYNESGDAKHFGVASSYVFYNLNKIGTYESWQSGKHDLE